MNIDNKIKCIECLQCKKLHKITSEDYYTIWGNITVGDNGGLVGNNLTEEMVVKNVSCFCVNEQQDKSCLELFLHNLIFGQ